ncbi:MAG: zinc ribbon domain-containing protein [Desulfobacteraceae bacterium]|nr:MAG: zinc ribbon domain-containing protein [Desulfobacteraceae bacterium]
MPIYEYQCDHCGRVEEVLQKITDESLTRCNHCSGKLHKLISQSSFHLKGTGWYVTDYAGKSKTQSNAQKPETASKTAESGESKPTTEGTSSNDD